MVLDYSDRTTYHSSKSFLESITARYLNMLAAPRIMLNGKLTIVATYRESEAELRWMTEWLRNRFMTMFSRDFPALQVV